jgi:hypothetical protein
MIFTLNLQTLEYFRRTKSITKIQISSKSSIFISPIYLLGTFYVYTDIIDNQFFGNTKAPLLKTIVINYNNSQSISW